MWFWAEGFAGHWDSCVKWFQRGGLRGCTDCGSEQRDQFGLAAEKRARRGENPRGSEWTRTLDLCVVCVCFHSCVHGWLSLSAYFLQHHWRVHWQGNVTHTHFTAQFSECCLILALCLADSRLCEPLWPATRPPSFAPCQLLQTPVTPEPGFGAKYLTCQKPFLLFPLIFHPSQHKLGPASWALCHYSHWALFRVDDLSIQSVSKDTGKVLCIQRWFMHVLKL